MPVELKFYPGLKQLLEREWDDYRRRKGRISLREAASKMRMKSPSALHSWLRGERLPKGPNIKALAEFFYPDDEEKQKKFVLEVGSAASGRAASGLVDPLNLLVTGRKELRVGVVDYKPFSGDDSDFFNMVFNRFVAFASISERGVRPSIVTLDEVYQKLAEGELDVALGILATPDRALRMHFFKSPIKIPVNAVMFESRGADQHKLRETLLSWPRDEKAERYIYPIISEKEVGGLHVKNFLNIRSENYFAVEYSPEKYARALVESQRRLVAGGPIPVVVADELMCLRVIQRINERNGLSSDLRTQTAALVYRGSESRSASDAEKAGSGRSRPLMPRYRLCFAVNRNHVKWISYLEEAFEIFLDSNRELLVSYYSDLFRDLKFSLQTSIAGGIDDEINRWLSLTDEGRLPASDPWARIIERARELDFGGPTRTTKGQKATTPKGAQRK